MISIKKFLERNAEELFRVVLNAYLSVLRAVGESGVQACPPVGNTLRQNLLHLQAALSGEATPDVLQETGEKVEAELAQWGSAAAEYLKSRAGDVKELMLILASTADLTMERDQRYSRQFQKFTGRLQTMVDLHDLAMIRSSLVQSAIDLKACTEAMAEESREASARLRRDLNVYKARLEDAERLAVLDPLTGLDNRRRVESSIEHRIGQKKAFSVLLLDLNGFKKLNDTFGHMAADEILKQFSTELKAGFRSTDVVGRWGGDEFIVILDAGLQTAVAHIDRISRWVFGDYTIKVGDTRRKVAVSAAIGAAEWRPGDSLRMLLDRADAAMYNHKRARTNAGNSGP
jgi:diguanylate cyclase (GGDEF)-like protein